MAEDHEEVRAELVGAPPELHQLQAEAQQEHETVPADQTDVAYGHGELTYMWRRSGHIDGTGPRAPGYYFEFVPLPALSHFVNGR
jgi:hypothetical protein